ncbi:unnamed protein product [Paramecium pentaurelia]|uniref:Uncharacterized protein n=1 Tax=Paramecium pentaurelia TaxID=43138 RepID=A0A8S1U1P8_9CILI|nr:unnamed protein product [Paramecium pentaurelia]
MLPQANIQLINKQLCSENFELKLKLGNLKLELERQVLLSKEGQEWKDKYEQLYKQNQSLDQEKKQLQDEITKLNDQIKNTEYSVQQQLEKTRDLNNYEQIKNNAIIVQKHNLDLQRELEQYRQKQLFKINSKITNDNTKQYYSIILEWDNNIKNLQLTYRQVNDSLIFDGYGEREDQKIVYQQIHHLEKKTLKQNQKPLISLKQSQMRLIFEV